MTPTALSIAALAVSLIGNLVQFGLLLIHCRRDKRELEKLRADAR